MKKALLVSGLGLIIATSVLSGTMATYTQNIDVLSDVVTAKRFIVRQAGNTEVQYSNVKGIAPGEDMIYTFTVANNDGTVAAQTDLQLEIEVLLHAAADPGSNLPLSITLQEESTEGSWTDVAAKSLAGNDGTAAVTFEDDEIFEATVSKAKDYRVVVRWESLGGVEDTLLQGKAGQRLEVNVTGTQVAENTPVIQETVAGK